MKVWLLIYQGWEDFSIDSGFIDLTKAQEALEKAKLDAHKLGNDVDIYLEEVEIKDALNVKHDEGDLGWNRFDVYQKVKE